MKFGFLRNCSLKPHHPHHLGKPMKREVLCLLWQMRPHQPLTDFSKQVPWLNPQLWHPSYIHLLLARFDWPFQAPSLWLGGLIKKPSLWSRDPHHHSVILQFPGDLSVMSPSEQHNSQECSGCWWTSHTRLVVYQSLISIMYHIQHLFQ